MKKNLQILLFTLLAIIQGTSTQAQNLVYNGDFEIYDTCPPQYSQPYGDDFVKYCLGWYSPTFATPDYFNACHLMGIVGVPNNGAGFQEAKSGVAYCGSVTYSAGFSPGQTGYWSEYIQSKLMEPLESGKIYTCTFFVSLANESYFASSKIGAYFSVDSISSYQFIPLNFKPQVCSDYFITDTSNWVEISGTFTATGGESYITIGHFGDSLLADTLRCRFDTIPTIYDLGYYYIEDVSVYLCDECATNFLYVPNIFSPNMDGKNDVFYVRSRNIAELEFLVFNRWGELVFETNDMNTGWNGMYKGKSCDPDVFTYYIKALFEDGTEQIKKGSITLVR
jgi:gliding motility-associated-like protein